MCLLLDVAKMAVTHFQNAGLTKGDSLLLHALVVEYLISSILHPVETDPLDEVCTLMLI